MKELKDIVRAYDKAIIKNKKTALATVVKVEGSSYRRPGARMLVTDDGTMTGAISGGCLEGDALQKAQFAMATGENKLITYDSTDEDDIQFGLHLGCNGIVHILFEPIKKEDPVNPVELLRKISESGEEAVLMTLFSNEKTQPGTRLLYQGDNQTGGVKEPEQKLFSQAAETSFAEKKSAFLAVHMEETDCTAFVEYIGRQVSIVIAGAGNDVQPLVELASMMGWSVTIVDGRYHYAIQQRFPKADKVLYRKPPHILADIKTDDESVFLLMTHNYNYDLALLKLIVQQPFAYVGLLGPAQKRNRMFSDLADAGLVINEEQHSKIHGPVGLDIGAENASEIALSVVAEIKAFLSKRSASSLKLKRESIHGRLINDLHHG